MTTRTRTPNPVVPPERSNPQVVRIARALALTAHMGQRDDFGDDLTAGTLTRVARLLRLSEPPLQAAGWLHLIVTRTDYTLDTLRVAGIPDDVIAIVDALTQRPGEPPDRYVERVSAHPQARVVAMAALTAQLQQLDDLSEADPGTAAQALTEQARCLRTRTDLMNAELRGDKQ